MAKSSASKPVVWVLMGLLIIGLGGFGATNLGGGLRSIGTVGDVDLSVQDYFNGIQQELRVLQSERGQAIRFSEAQELGLSERVLAQMIAQAAFESETAALGLSIGDANLRDQILSMPQFRGLDGAFDREAYRFSLENSGQSESQFESAMRAQAATNLLQASVISGINAPQPFTMAMMTFLGERREVSWSILDRADIATGLPVASEEDLRTFHAEQAELFTTPESKRITYAWLTPDMIMDTVEIDEEALREAYENAADQFNRPERRLVERLVFGNEDDLLAAKARIDSGEVDFTQIVEERGLQLADIDMGEVDRTDLGAIAEPIFAASVGDVVGPLQSALGPALFRVNALLSEQVTSFEDATPLLRPALANDRARRVVDQAIDPVDDLLVGGATVEDVAAETELELGQIDWHAGLSDGIAAYPAFRQAAAQVSETDYPEVLQLADGGIFTIQLLETVPPTLQPFEEVRDAVEATWNNRALLDALNAKAEPLLERLDNGAGFDEVGLSIDGTQALTRQSRPGVTPAEFIEIVFGLDEGGAAVIEGDGRLFILKLDSVSPPDLEDEGLRETQTFLENQTASGIAQDLFAIVADEFRDRAGVDLDYTSINAVHTNFN